MNTIHRNASGWCWAPRLEALQWSSLFYQRTVAHEAYGGGLQLLRWRSIDRTRRAGRRRSECMLSAPVSQRCVASVLFTHVREPCKGALSLCGVHWLQGTHLAVENLENAKQSWSRTAYQLVLRLLWLQSQVSFWVQNLKQAFTGCRWNVHFDLKFKSLSRGTLWGTSSLFIVFANGIWSLV